MSWRLTAFAGGVLPTLENVPLRGSLEGVVKYLGTVWPAKLVHVARGQAPVITLHRESGDGASGPFGHLGVCVARVETT